MSLPRTPSVADILNDYVASVKASADGVTAVDALEMDILAETVEGIRVYFDRALGVMLLYHFERPQYGEILKVPIH